MQYLHAISTLLAAGLLSMAATTAPAAPNDASLPSPRQSLVLLNWSEYIDPELVEKFEQQFNAEVREVYFESDDLRDDMMLETSSIGYDLVIVNGINVDNYRKRGWIAPLDEARLPNLKYVDRHWRDAFEGAGGYAVPYFWGTLGIAYRKDLVEQAPSSWMDILQPAESLRGKIGMIENSRDLMGMALKALGHSANSTDPAAIKAAEQLLLAQKPYVKTYHYIALTEESALVSGNIVAAMVYSGDALMVQEFDENIQYLVPAEGGNIWVDYLAVVESSKNKDLAWAFINFLNEPEHAAQLAEYVYYATPNTAAEKLLPQEFLEDPVIYPSKEALARSEFHTPLPPRAAKKRNLAFARVRQ
ncbi:MAG: spermidine/putrescine ABC transporter substrate-binding protein [Gammaproteobacteria bacterium]|nr:MAG: spermidine/putrescine ABC transporter substrate-binding protein [Gammaproteobacteria bacterium]